MTTAIPNKGPPPQHTIHGPTTPSYQYKYYDLLREEQAFSLNALPSTTTITFYKYNPSKWNGNSKTSPIDQIRTRVTEILRLNPWLGGRLVWHNKKRMLRVRVKSTENLHQIDSDLIDVVITDSKNGAGKCCAPGLTEKYERVKVPVAAAKIRYLNVDGGVNEMEVNPWRSRADSAVSDIDNGMTLSVKIYSSVDTGNGDNSSTLEEELDLASHFEILENCDVKSTDSFAHVSYLIHHRTKCVIKKGTAAHSNQSPLFKVTVLLNHQVGELAVVLSISHTIADGHTYYQIYNFLDQNAVVRALTVERNLEWDKEVGKLFPDHQRDGNFAPGFGWYPYMLITVILGVLCYLFRAGVLFWRKENPRTIWEIDSQWIKEEKKRYSGLSMAGTSNDVTPSWVSTNDCLTSWFLKASKSQYGIMMVNTRKRMPNVCDDHAGNYTGFLYLDEESFADPTLIRRSITGTVLQRVSRLYREGFAHPRTFPMRLGLVSNWCTFYKNVQLDGCTLVRHQPAMDDEPVPFSTCLIFAPREGDVAVIITAVGSSATGSEGPCRIFSVGDKLC
ncbi:hypothetical protein HDU76_008476 [Blyttiomyces sp. JEL0837]|nr:hypothetical protein HDU76_008476 [Blyttiomyces sp. JEL0837]